VGSMDVAAPPVVEATVADAVRTSVVTRNYYQNNFGLTLGHRIADGPNQVSFAIPLLELAPLRRGFSLFARVSDGPRCHTEKSGRSRGPDVKETLRGKLFLRSCG
jgi:hypothetical protein